MKTAKLVINYQDQNETAYAVLFHGYATERRLYLKRVSACEDSCQGVKYVSVSKRDTVPYKENGLHKPDVSRVMLVDTQKGLKDPRIKSLNRLHDIILIESAAKEF